MDGKPTDENAMDCSCFRARSKILPLNRTYIMGILNVTPDSFSDGGRYVSVSEAAAHAKRMLADGADIIDVGGQSTRPGYERITEEEEWERIEPVLSVLCKETEAIVSVDTFYHGVAVRALELGAHIINDVSGFGEEMMRAVADSGCGCIVMHPTGSVSGRIVQDVRGFFGERLLLAGRTGIAAQRLCFDAGIGFGKTYEDNLRLLANVRETKVKGVAYLMAASKKRVIGEPAGNPPFAERVPGTIAAHTIAQAGGADILRVHDVKEAVQAAKVGDAILRYSRAT